MTSMCVDILGGSDTLRKHPPLCPLCGGNSYHLSGIESRCSDTFGNADALRQLTPVAQMKNRLVDTFGDADTVGKLISMVFLFVGIKTRYADTSGPQFLLCCWDQDQVC